MSSGTPIIREAQGAPVQITAANMPASSLATNTISGAITRITASSFNNAMLLDAWISGSFGTDPAGAGALQLIVVPRSLSGDQGPVPTAATARLVYSAEIGSTGNTAKVFSFERIPLPVDCDLYLYNNNSGYTLTYTNSMNGSAYAFQAQPWSPGT